MTVQAQAPLGIIQLANRLAAGIGVESVAYAEIGKAANTYGDCMNDVAQDEYQKGQEMIKIQSVMKCVNIATVIVGLLTLGAGGAISAAAGAGSSGFATALSSGVNGVSQACQAALAGTQSGLQTAKSEIQATAEIDDTSLQFLGKTAENDTNVVKNESQGAGKLGAAINTMLQNEGAIERQKITH
jgi:hypothetical protein